MRKFLSTIFMFLSIVSFASAEIKEGREYEVLPFVVKNAENSLIKVSRYNCPFCYKYDELFMDKVMINLPEFNYMPYHSAVGASFGKYASKVLSVMIAKDMEDGVSLVDEKSSYHRTIMAIYTAYHKENERWGNNANDDKNVEKFLKTALKPTGMSIDEYEKRLQNSNTVEILNAWGLDESGMAANLAEIQGVPSFIVNGKYLIKYQAIKTPTQLAELIKEVSNLD
ncbi:MAG: thiol:disulfide interchange protein [Campylobacter sp.]|nr:thiol:disulfide interchange protein [Campylobacter sp.]